MKVFISWSGTLSQNIAILLRDWIGDVLQGTEVWISSDDIDKGSLWFGDIGTQLATTSVGILCLTRENITAPWVLFEAGALSKGLSKTRVCPLLINLPHAELKPPLSQFNGTLPMKDDMLKLIRTINAQNADKALSEDRIQKSFEKWWDDFNSKFSAILTEYKPTTETHRRSVENMVQEILEITRSIQKSQQWESEQASLNAYRTTFQDAQQKYLNDPLLAAIGDKTMADLIMKAALSHLQIKKGMPEQNQKGAPLTSETTSPFLG